MSEILPIKLLTDEDSPIFGTPSVALGKLAGAGLPVAPGVVVTAPDLRLKTVLEHYDFTSKEVFEQSLTLVKKEINAVPVPDVLNKEVGKHKRFLVNGRLIGGVRKLWLALLNFWIEEIRNRIWREGFYKGITEELEPQIVVFVKKTGGWGSAHFDSLQDDTVINIKKGKLHPSDLKKIDELVKEADKKLFIPHEYEWILDNGVKLSAVLPFTPNVIPAEAGIYKDKWIPDQVRDDIKKSTVKVFLDLSTGFTIEKEIDGVYIASEKIFDLNKPRDSFENLIFKLVESATSFPSSPILFKLADKSEGMGKVRGSLRLLHQDSLLHPLMEALDFARHKKSLTNIHIVVPFVRSVQEFLQIKRELAVKKLGRKNSLQLWLELAVPENIVNLEEYLLIGLDGVVLNLDELAAYFGGFDNSQEELVFYKNEVNGLLKFLEDGLKLLHKFKVPFITYGSLSLYPQVLEYLVEKGVHGIVMERYEVPSAKDLLNQAEKRMILRKAQ